MDAVKILLSAVNARTSDALLEMQNKDKETPLAISQRLAEQRGDQHYQVIHEYLRGVITEKESKAEKVKEELVQQEELKEERERKKLQKLKASAQATGQKASRVQLPPVGEDTKVPSKDAVEDSKVANA
jgi:DNA anti-recombination protein RmuC